MGEGVPVFVGGKSGLCHDFVHAADHVIAFLVCVVVEAKEMQPTVDGEHSGFINDPHTSYFGLFLCKIKTNHDVAQVIYGGGRCGEAKNVSRFVDSTGGIVHFADAFVVGEDDDDFAFLSLIVVKKSEQSLS